MNHWTPEETARCTELWNAGCSASKIAAILGNGRSSRLYQAVREKRGLVTSVDAWTYSPGTCGLLGVSAVVEADKFLAAREAILLEIEAIRSAPVSAAELAKAEKQFIAGALSSRKTMQGQAQDLGSSWLAANDLSFSERYLAAVRAVTPADLQRVARDWLTPENRTLYALLPAGQAPLPVAVVAAEVERPVQRFQLANGLRLLVKEDHRLPFVEFRTVFTGGVLAETAEISGLTQLMGKLLLKGTRTRSAEEISLAVESVGGSIDSYSGNNSFGLNAEVMTGDFATGLELVSDVLLHPIFPDDALEREREVQLAGIRAQRDHPLHSASQAMRRALFGEIGYGLDAIGSQTSVEKLTASDLRAFHARWTTPNNCVLAIYGDVHTDAVRAAVETQFGAWGPAGYPLGADARVPSPVLDSVKRVTETRDKKQGVLVIGFRGASLFDPDRYPLELLQETCSDLGSRLFLRIRERLGLAYYVGAQNSIGLVPGFFAFYAGTTPEKLALVESEMLAEAALLRAEGLTAEELSRSKAKILGQRKIARQDLGGLATAAALDEIYGLGYNYSETEDAIYEAVTAEQVVAAARKYLTPEAMVVAVVRPA